MNDWAGWRIDRASCRCGGAWAWTKPHSSGAREMVGCVCHHTPPELHLLLSDGIDLSDCFDLDEL